MNGLVEFGLVGVRLRLRIIWRGRREIIHKVQQMRFSRHSSYRVLLCLMVRVAGGRGKVALATLPFAHGGNPVPRSPTHIQILIMIRAIG